MRFACQADIWPLLSAFDTLKECETVYVYNDYIPEFVLHYDVVLDTDLNNLQKLLLHDGYRGTTLVWFSKSTEECVLQLSKQVVLCTDVDEVMRVLHTLIKTV